MRFGGREQRIEAAETRARLVSTSGQYYPKRKLKSSSSPLVAGGVSANQGLRATFLAQNDLPVIIPPLSLCTDNAAMIASAGYRRFVQGFRDSYDFDAMPTWPLP